MHGCCLPELGSVNEASAVRDAFISTHALCQPACRPGAYPVFKLTVVIHCRTLVENAFLINNLASC